MSPRKKRKQAVELLRAANKVYHYRRDRLSTESIDEIRRASDDLHEWVRRKRMREAGFDAAMRRLDDILREHGGRIHPKTFLSDNIEVVLVAAIIVLGIRTFFFQPFIIPTNSMYPTYSGMREIVYDVGEEPNALRKAFRFARLGARHYRAEAPATGEVAIPLFPALFSEGRSLPPQVRRAGGGAARFDVVSGRKFLVVPAKKREYTLYVGGRAVSLRVPLEFSLDEVLRQTFFPEFPDMRAVVQAAARNGRLSEGDGAVLLPAGERRETGEAVVDFDIALGDALFVDRVSYHFTRPKAGDPFVFRTRGIEALPDKYYIKRVAGVPGDSLRIKDGALHANGEPRDEAEAFRANAQGRGAYDGYRPKGFLAEDETLEVPEDRYVALGDNSDSSKDSRYWGFVPRRAIVGRAFFIYYPFTERWGLAE